MQSVARSDIPRLAGILHEAARGLSQRLGCRVYPFGAAAKPASRRLATTG
jgi:hypothetical protein